MNKKIVGFTFVWWESEVGWMEDGTIDIDQLKETIDEDN